MRAIDLYNIHGLKKLKNWYEKNIGTTSTYKKYVCFDSLGNLTGVINCGTIHVLELKRLIDTMEIRSGSRVRCINDEGQKILKKGQHYTVTTMHHTVGKSTRCWIKEHKRFSFLSTRFEVITDEYPFRSNGERGSL